MSMSTGLALPSLSIFSCSRMTKLSTASVTIKLTISSVEVLHKKNKFGTCSVENTDYETSLSIISQQNNGFSDSHITISDIFRIFSEMWFPKFHTL